MPAPAYKGSFPVIVSESTNRSVEGKYEFVQTKVYSLATLATPTIGSSLSKDNLTLSLTNFSISKKDGLATLTQTFTGADTSAPDVYEVVATTQEEPIASHPAFTATTTGFSSSIVSAAGGIVTEGSSASGGAVFNEDGSFVEFNKNATNNFFGVKSFLSPRVTYKRTYSNGTVPTYGGQVAYIFAVPRGSPPAIPTGRNWLMTGVSWQNNGNINTNSGQYQITEEYLSSGPSGWNNVIYYTA